LSSYLAAGEEDSSAWTQFVQAATMLDRALDFIALPLFVYGLVALLVAQRQLISWLLSSVTYFVGGSCVRCRSSICRSSRTGFRVFF